MLKTIKFILTFYLCIIIIFMIGVLEFIMQDVTSRYMSKDLSFDYITNIEVEQCLKKTSFAQKVVEAPIDKKNWVFVYNEYSEIYDNYNEVVSKNDLFKKFDFNLNILMASFGKKIKNVRITGEWAISDFFNTHGEFVLMNEGEENKIYFYSLPRQKILVEIEGEKKELPLRLVQGESDYDNYLNNRVSYEVGRAYFPVFETNKISSRWMWAINIVFSEYKKARSWELVYDGV